jgi:hypothetical protein
VIPTQPGPERTQAVRTSSSGFPPTFREALRSRHIAL